MKKVVGDYLTLNRATPVRVFENRGILYVDHATSTVAPIVEYSENTLLDFSGAYYPKHLLEFMEKHGTLFNIDTQNSANALLDNGSDAFINSDYWKDARTPAEESLRNLFDELNYPDGKKRKVTQDFKWIQRECVNRESGYLWLANQREYLGDWVAARAMLQNALELLGGASPAGPKGKCPDFAVNLAEAPRYKKFLTDNIKGHAWDSLAHRVDGTTEQETCGLFIDGDLFRCHMPNHSVDEAISSLVTLHIKSGIRKACVNMELHESFLNLLQVIWYQIPEQIGSRLVIGWCENPRCGNVMLKFRDVEKHACCDSCAQTLKEGR